MWSFRPLRAADESQQAEGLHPRFPVFTDEAVMKRLLFCALGLLAAAQLFTTRAVAQQQNDVQYASASNSELSELYARLANLEARAANTTTGGGGSGCCECCGRSGFVAAGEIMWLKAYQSDGDFGDFNFRDGYRFWVGYQGDSGLGARLRYFDYFQRAPNTGDFINIYALDGEIYDNVAIGCYWDLIVGAGFRVLGYEASDAGPGRVTDALWGVGPVVTAELYRHLGDRAALYAITRQSIIVGSGRDDGTVTQDTTGSVTELQLGLQLHTYWGNSLVFGRLGWETQAYYDIDDGEELVTLMGVAFSGGVMY